MWRKPVTFSEEANGEIAPLTVSIFLKFFAIHFSYHTKKISKCEERIYELCLFHPFK